MQNLSAYSQSGLSLSFFRVGFGIVITLQLLKFKTLFTTALCGGAYNIPYPFLEFIHLPSIGVCNTLFNIAIVSSVCFTLGLFYRLSAIVMFSLFTYFFLCEMSIYNNHFYLFAIISFLMTFLSGNAFYSLDKLLFKKHINSVVPQWQTNLLKWQIGIVYLFGAIAKLNYDWLVNAQPVKLWLPDMLGNRYDILSAQQATLLAYVISYAAFIIDFCVAFLLFHNRFKYYAFGVLLLFHALNSMMFSIGYFPLFGIVSLILFLNDADWQILASKFRVNLPDTNSEKVPSTQMPVKIIMGTWLFIQLLLPFRHYLYNGDVRWNMFGYNFSWFMKLNDYEPLLRFEVQIEGDPQPYTFDINQLTSLKSQRYCIATYPTATVHFAKAIEHYLRQTTKTRRDIRVYCDSYVSLNGRPMQRKINPTIDLTQVHITPATYFTNNNWIVNLGDYSFIDTTVLESAGY